MLHKTNFDGIRTRDHKFFLSSRDGAIFSRRKFLARFRIFLDLEPQGPQVEVVVVLGPPGAVREAVAAQRRVPTFPVFGQTWKLNDVPDCPHSSSINYVYRYVKRGC